MSKNHGEIIRTMCALVMWCMASIGAAGVMDTGGQLSVTASGAAVYGLSIQVPPGVAGIKPNLALTYNSQGGNGLLGMGWSLNGMSAVTRCPRTIAQDAVRGGIKFDANDRFCLDGQRLLVINGTYGADGAEYRTELDTFSKIISYGVAGTGPAWFKVWNKSGQRLEYGNTSDSRIIAQPFASARTWAINKISDTKTNYLTYSYELEGSDGDYHPTYINYTGNTSTSIGTTAQVKFNYATRPDVIEQYVSGSKIKRTQRMTSVETRVDQGAGPVGVKEYRFTYNNGCNGSSCAGSGRSRLATIAECALPSNLCKPALTFGWNDGGASAFQTPSTTMTTQGLSQLTDMNGDGRDDLVYFATNGIYVTLATSTGWGARQPWSTQVIADQNETPVFLQDVSGDGKPDLVIFTATGITVALGTGSGFSSATNWSSSFGIDTGWTTADLYPRMLVDVNGDGRPDVLGFRENGVHFSLNTGTAFQAPNLFAEFGTTSTIPYPSNDTPRYVQDVNGDGLPDIVGFAADGIHVSLNTGSSFAASTPVLAAMGINQGWDTTDHYPRVLADVNGDGLPDIVGFWQSSVLVAINTGAGFLAPVSWREEFGATQGYASDSATPRFVIDVNGDRKADIVGFATTGARVSLSNGSGFSASTQWLADFGSSQGYDTDSTRQLADIDGDGLPDIVGTVDLTTTAAKRGTLVGIDLMTSVSNGLGTTASVTYQPMTNSNVYAKASDAVFPIADLQSTALVAATLQSPNGLSFTTTSYQYGGAKASAYGRNLGFAWQQASNAESGLVARTDFRQDWPYVGLPTQVKVTHSNAAGPNNQVSLVNNTYSCVNPATGASCNPAIDTRFAPYQSQTIERAWDLLGSAMPVVTTSRFVDNYGNVTSVNVSTDDGFSKTVANTYTYDTVNWLIGQVVSSQVSATGPDPSAPLPSVTLTTVSPTTGSTGGGTTITLSGTNFTSGATATVGGVAATGCVFVSSASITCVAPAGTVGIKDVVVYSAGGTATKSNAFTYVAGSFTFNTTISAAMQNYNLKSAAIAAGWNQTVPLVSSVTVNAGITVGASSTSSYAFDTGAGFPAGSSLALINNGTIVGAGGNGGNGSLGPTSGGTGGSALRAQFAVSVTNNGTIAGGGGGGGGGLSQLYNKLVSGEPWIFAEGGGGGGGGAGSVSGTGGTGDTNLDYDTNGPGNPGQAGTATAGGAGGLRGAVNWAVALNGGAGGGLGTAGTTSGTVVGGAAGAYAVGNASITWVVAGTRLGGAQ
jgi:IPT/TIG domain/Salmonella virulence plasmid 65kDa B protein/Insecticide toxin TcdB middle/N-terminal region/FG-GAP-like repeat